MQIKLIYNAKVVSGKIVLEFPFKLKNEVANTFNDMDITLTIEKKKKKRSLSQNAYYFGVVCSLVKNGMNEFGSEYDIEETHEFLKSRFNLKEVVNTNTGEVTKIPFSTTKLNTIEFMTYIERIQRFASEELGIIIPDPEPINIVTIHESNLTVTEKL